MGMILDYIEQAGKGKYQCFKTKKICLDSVDNPKFRSILV